MLTTENFQLISNWTQDKHTAYVQQLSQAAGSYFKDHLIFPDDAALAYLSEAVYQDDGGALEIGWACIATEHNLKSGYFGAAYWHDAKRELVIAYRGMEAQALDTFRKDFYVDINSIVRGEVSTYMGEAYAFTRHVITAVQTKGSIHSLSFTGHSLGGWLAQVMTLYTAIDGLFAHTVVFDSPGARPMLEGSQHNRASHERVKIDGLDVTTYLSMPNLVNTCHEQVGTRYQLYPELPEWKGLLGKPKELWEYARKSHDMAMLLSLFRPGTHRRPEKVSEVVDWPVTEWKDEKQTQARGWWWSKQLKSLSEQDLSEQDLTEYQTFFEFAEQANHYNPQGTNLNQVDTFLLNYKAHYRVKARDDNQFSFRFDKDSQQLIREICQINTYIKLDTSLDCVKQVNATLDKYFKQHSAKIKELIKDLKEENDKLSTTFSADAVRNAIYVFRLFFPEVVQAIKEVKSKFVPEMASKQVQSAAPALSLIGTIAGTLKVKNLIRAPQAEFLSGQKAEAVGAALDLARGWREIRQQYPNQNAKFADNVNDFEAENIIEEPIVRMTALPPQQEHWPSSSTSPYTPAYGHSKTSSSSSNTAASRSSANNALTLPEGITLSADKKTVHIDVGHFEDETVMAEIQNVLKGKKRGEGSDYYESHGITRSGKVDEITFDSTKGAENLIKELNRVMDGLELSAPSVASMGKC